MEFYAKWKPKQFDVKLDLNGGIIEGAKNSIFLKYTYGEELILPTNIKKNGYTFEGWYIYEQGQKTKITKIEALTSGNQTVHAEYKNVVYNITLIEGGGKLKSEAPKTYVHGSAVYLPICLKEGYEFLGWSERENSTDNIVTYISYEDYGNKVYYAVYEAKRYTIAMYLGDDSVTLQYVLFGDPIKIEDPVRHGYKFDKWYVDKELTTEYIPSKTMPAESLNIYAGWIPLKFKMNFDTCGGTPEIINPVEVDCGASLLEYKPVDPTYKGKRFIGWFETKEVIEGEIPFNFEKMPCRNFILYARYGTILSGITANSIKYYDGAKELALEPSKYKNGEGAYLPEPTKEGYIFAGWHDNEGLQGDPIRVITTTNNKNQVLYSRWIPKKSYIVYVEV